MRTDKDGPMRKVTAAAVSPYGRTKSVATWELECGHVLLRKGKTPVPDRAHCPECARATRPDETGGARCRVCGCTDDDCSGCIERTGEPCHWVEADLCSVCAGKGQA